MALTKIGTGGIKDDAASQAKIADEAIDEARLQISNAGSNGQFLQKTSNTGGLTWADAGGASSIADNSVAEVKLGIHADPSGTNKFLGYTSNGMEWAVPPDTNTTYSVQDGQLSQNNFTNADHSKLDGIAASANNYAISADLLDEDDMSTNSATKVPSQQSVKAYTDTTFAPKAAPAFTGTATGVNLTLSGDLTVNGTTTTINSTTLSVDDKNIELGSVSSPSDATADGGGITLKGATDKTINWVNSTDAWTFSDHINIAAGKKLGVGGANYGTSGHVLTSGGSGAAPSWAAPAAGGNSIDLVADGAIAAGKPCVILTNGKAQQTGPSVATATTSHYGSTTQWQSDDTLHMQGTAYDPDTNHVFVCYQKNQSGNEYPYLSALAIPSNGTATHTVAQEVNSTSESTHCSVIYEPTQNLGIAFYKAAGKIRIRAFSFDGSSISMKSNTYYIEASDQYITNYVAQPIGSSSRFVTFWTYQGNHYVQMNEVGSGGGVTQQTKVQVDSNASSSYPLSMAIDTASSTIILTYDKYVRVCTYSGTTITMGAAGTSFSSTSRETHKIAWSPSLSKFVLIYKESDANPVFAIVGSLTGSGATRNVSLGSETTIYNTQDVSDLAIGVDTSISTGDEFTIAYNSDGSVTNKRVWAQKLSVSGTTPSLTGSVSDISADTGNDGKNVEMVFVNHNTVNGFAVTFTRNHNTNTGHCSFVRSSESGSNINASNFIGFAPSAISDTATGTINTFGNSVDGQSGLTAGTRYFINDDGTLGTNGSSSAVNNHGGLIAVSSSKGVIVGPSGFT